MLKKMLNGFFGIKKYRKNIFSDFNNNSVINNFKKEISEKEFKIDKLKRINEKLNYELGILKPERDIPEVLKEKYNPHVFEFLKKSILDVLSEANENFIKSIEEKYFINYAYHDNYFLLQLVNDRLNSDYDKIFGFEKIKLSLKSLKPDYAPPHEYKYENLRNDYLIDFSDKNLKINNNELNEIIEKYYSNIESTIMAVNIPYMEKLKELLTENNGDESRLKEEVGEAENKFENELNIDVKLLNDKINYYEKNKKKNIKSQIADDISELWQEKYMTNEKSIFRNKKEFVFAIFKKLNHRQDNWDANKLYSLIKRG